MFGLDLSDVMLDVAAELLGHARLDQTRRYTLPTSADRRRAVELLPTDR